MASSNGSGSFGSDVEGLLSSSSLSGSESPQARADAAANVRPRSPAESARLKTAPGHSYESGIEGPGITSQMASYYDQIYGRTDRVLDYRHETLMSVFRKHEDTFNRYLSTKDMSVLKTFILHNFGKIVWLDYLEDKLKELVEAFATAEQKRMVLKYDYNPDTMIRVLRVLLEDYQRKFAVMDLSVEFPETADGLEVIIEKSRRKMSNVIAELQSTIKDQQNEIGIMKDNLSHMDELRAALAAARNHIKYLHEKDRFVVADPSTRELFMQDLQFQLNMQEQLSSSLRDELEQERKSKGDILEQYLQVETARIQEHQKKMREIAEATKHLEMEEVIQQGIIAKIKTLSANPADVKKSVDEWIRTIQQVIEENKEEIYSLTMKSRELLRNVTSTKLDIEERSKEIPALKAEFDRMTSYVTDLKTQIEELKTDVTDATAKLERMTRDLRDLTFAYRLKEELYETRVEEYEKLRDELDVLDEYYRSMKEQMRRVPEHLSELSREQSARVLKTIPERRRVERKMTPRQYERLTPRMKERLTPEMKKRLGPEEREVLRGDPFSPEQISEEYFAALDSSGTPTYSPSPPRVSPELQIPDIMITPPPAPITTEAVGPYLTAPSPESPLTLKDHFTYTDPAEPVRELDMPSTSHNIPAPLRQTVVLPSPKKDESLIVNIAVDPKPIIETPNGSHFVCDISLGVTPKENSSMLPQMQQKSEGTSSNLDRPADILPGMSETPVIRGRVWRHNVPPEITPTSARRHGLFTPRGIFKRGYFNIRRVPGSHPISELPWSPTYLPEDARSPASPPSLSPIVWSNRSVSWERSPSPVIKGSTREYLSSEYDTSPSPIIKGVTDTYLSPESDRSPSPIIKRPTHRYLSSEYDTSPSPIIEGSTHGYLSSEYDTSPSPIIKGPTRGYLSSEYDTSPSPIIKGSTHGYLSSEYDTSPSPIIKGPTRGYLSSEYDTSPSPVIKGSSYRSPDSDSSSASSVSRRTHRDPSPVISSPLFDTPPSGYISELDQSRTPQSIRMYDDISSRTYQSPNESVSSQHPSYQESFLNRRMRLDDADERDVLNRRWQPDEMFHSDSSPSSPSDPIFDSSFSSHQRSYQEDPLNRRMQLNEMFGSIPEQSFSRRW